MFSQNPKIYLLVAMAFVAIAINCDALKMQQSGSMSTPAKRSGQEMTTLEAMVACNESFRTTEEFLQELNKTGSFPDESDKTPMCFLKCYLEKTSIISDEGDINDEKVLVMFPTLTTDGIDDCKKEMDHTNNVCEKVYFLVRCVMTRMLVDGRSSDNK
ncbi:general odorant-binding protein 84a [Phlebotomus argentipes]|uniref:general odorant-binding protein 84a n=1 Tax=Phlebotomus argentipes TaxID=94469 RepID=UPI002893434E|nr:general odorant-binding protein 84a [Phlebotomus argentipes]